MFARDTATSANTGFHQLTSRFFHSMHLIGRAGIETDERMQISVTGMEHVGNAQLVTGSYAIGRVEYFGQAGTRHNCILDHGVRGDAPDSAKRAFARRPKFFPFVLIASAATITSAILQADTFHAISFL